MMGDSGNLAAASSGIMSVSSLASGFAQSQAIRAQADYEQQQANTNARLAELNAEQTLKKGEKEAQAHKRKVSGLIGAQRAALAGQGVDIGTGSALAVQEETAVQGVVDEATIRNNAYREAWGLKFQAEEYRSKGRFAQISGRASARSTLLTGGLQALAYGAEGFGKYYSAKEDKAKEK